MKCAIYAGTFDPITNGHIDIIQRASRLCEKLLVAVAKNPAKQPLFDLEERVSLVTQATMGLNNVEVIGFSDLLVDLARMKQADCLIRGIRSSDDIEYEIQLAQLNQKLAGQLETIFLPPSVEWRYLSSTMIRDIFRHQGNIAPFVPDCVNSAIRCKKF